MFNFTKFWKIGNFVTLLLLIFSVVFLFNSGLDLGVDFTGGVLIEVKSDVEFSKEKTLELSDKFLENNIKNIVQLDGNKRLIIKLQQKDDVNKNLLIENIENAKAMIVSVFFQDLSLKFEKIDFVGATVGKEFFQKSIFAVLISLFGILCYLFIRFDWRFALSGIIGLIHDVVITFGFISLFGIEFNMIAVTAILTIIGYSINDSVIIFDRIREVTKLNLGKNFLDIINLSLNNTMTRTLFTSITTLLSAFVLILFGGKALYSFSVVVFFGIIIGTYSSIFIAAQLLVLFKPSKLQNIDRVANHKSIVDTV